MKQIVKPMIAAALMAMASGCAFTDPQKASVIAQPKAKPVRNITSFTPALRCMDELFAAYDVKNVVITSAGIPDATGKIGGGTKDMLISAVSRMSVRSNAFTFVDFDQTQADVAQLQGLVGITEDFRVPNYYIRGAVTQLDEGVIGESVGGSVAFPDFEIGASADQVVSVISVDMNVGKLVTRQILPGVSANNSIAVKRDGIGGDAGASIDKAGLFFNISLNKAEGPHAATRTLIELSAIEVLGKLTEVPYWRCLKIEQTNPEMMAQARQWFSTMSTEEQVTMAQTALVADGYFDGPVDGIYSQSLRSAVAHYQADNGLLASGRIDFDFYQVLMREDLAVGRQPAQAAEVRPDPTATIASTSVAANASTTASDETEAAAPPPAPLRLFLTTPKGQKPSYRPGEALAMTVGSSSDAYVYCYYSDANGAVARVFPNQGHPDAYIAAGHSASIPGKDALFDIVFDRPGNNEEILCLASPKEIGLNLPTSLKVPDLEPVPVRSTEDLVAAYRKLDPNGLTSARLNITVAN